MTNLKNPVISLFEDHDYTPMTYKYQLTTFYN